MNTNVNRVENFILRHIRLSVIVIYISVILIIELIGWRLVPFLLSYPPDFNEISNKTGTSTIVQYITIFLFTVIISIVVSNKTLKGLDGWSKLSLETPGDLGKIAEIRKKCMNMPYKIFWGQIILFNLPVMLVMLVIPFLAKVSIVISIKIMMISICLASTASVFLYAVYRRIFKAILLKTYLEDKSEGARVDIKRIIFIQIVPLIVTSMLIFSELGYSRLIDEKDDDVYIIYKFQIKNLIENHSMVSDANQLMLLLSKVNYTGTNPVYFIKKAGGEVITSDNSSLSKYLTYYIENPYKTDRIFSLDTSKQGIVMNVPTKRDGPVRAGVIFQVVSNSTMAYYLIVFYILLLVNILALYYVSKTLSDDISQVARGLNDIAEDEDMEKGRRLAVTSNDEIGDLVLAFNKIRERQLEYDRLKTEFMTNVSHELRTPVNVIFTAIQLVEKYTKDDFIKDADHSKEILITIKQNCLRLIRLINNLIDTTRIEAGFLKLKLHPVDIAVLIREITQSVTEYAKGKDIVLNFETQIDEKVIACDADKIERIMLNLLSNAIKFTQHGGKVFVKLYDKGDKVLISVKDTGIGIPEDKLKVIFERFRQVEQSLVRSHEGSGIGLALVKYLVEMHEGQIRVESEEGAGTEFIFELPAKTQSDEEVGQANNCYVLNDNVADKIKIEFSDINLAE